MLMPTEPIDRQSIKNPAPLLNVQACGWVGAAASPAIFEKSQEKSPTLKSRALSNMAPLGLSQRTIPIIIPNTIHGCKKKDL
jgi:hypothetical protein